MSEMRFSRPRVAPNESCVMCFKGDTTTALAFEGEAEWVIAGLIHMGMPEDDATALVSWWSGNRDGMVPAGELRMAFRACRECTGRVGFPVRAADDTIPVISPLAS